MTPTPDLLVRLGRVRADAWWLVGGGCGALLVADWCGQGVSTRSAAHRPTSTPGTQWNRDFAGDHARNPEISRD